MDVCTRWNSTSEMMEDADHFKLPLQLWYERGGNCAQILDSQWKNGALINEILSPLKEATLKLSSFATITIHLVLWGVYKDYTPQRSTTTTQGVVVSRYPTDDSTVRLIT